MAVALTAASCSEDPAQALPPGFSLAGDAKALSSILERLEGIRGTPLARTASQLREKLNGCGEFLVNLPEPRIETLMNEIACVDKAAIPIAMQSLRGDAAVVFVSPLPSDGRIAGTIHIDPQGSVEVSAQIDPLPSSGFAAYLIPDDSPPGPAILSSRNTLIHGRIRPEAGLNLAQWVGDGSQADALFKLKSELFLGTVLAGNLEVATYLPDPELTMPPVALGIDVRVQTGAVAAMEKFIADLEATWPIHRSPVQMGPHSGACFFDLRILPEFAPCYVATDRALVIGWNPPSIRHALGSNDRGPLGDAGGLVIELDRVSEADNLLQQALRPDEPPADFDYAWDRMIVTSRRAGTPVQLTLSLESADAS